MKRKAPYEMSMDLELIVTGEPYKGEKATRLEPGHPGGVEDVEIELNLFGHVVGLNDFIEALPAKVRDKIMEHIEDEYLTEASEHECEEFQAAMEEAAERRSGR